MYSLYDYQEEAILALRKCLGRHNHEGTPARPMLQAPTGAGKTIISAEICRMAALKRKRVIFTVPAIELIDQTVDKFYQNGITDIGVIQANHPMTNYARSTQVASVQSLMRRDIPKADMVIVDEAHRDYKMIEEWMSRDEWQNVPFIGMSATPWTKGLGLKYTDLIVVETIAGLIDRGYLSKFKVFAPTSVDMKKVRTVAGDFHNGDSSDVMRSRTIIADVVDTWLEKAKGLPTIVFAVDRAHAQELQEAFKEKNVSCGYVDAYTKKAAREQIKWAFEAKKVDVVVNVGVLTTGVDWDVRCISIARPTKSEILFVQIIGRGLRTAEGKDECLILDHADNHFRMGLVTDIHYENLDTSKKGERKNDKEVSVKLPRYCVRCKALREAGISSCTVCGFKPQLQSDIDVENARLEEFQTAIAVKPKKGTREEKQAFYSEVLTVASERGYTTGWAAHLYKSKFGVWPQCLHKDPKQPTMATLNYVKSRLIAYAKRKGNR